MNHTHAPDASVTRLEIVQRDDEGPSAYLERWLDGQAMLIAAGHGLRAGWSFRSLEDLVSKLGMAWTAAPLPSFVTRGEPHKCYANALSLIREAKRYGLELDYVEGFALDPLSGDVWLHAWAVDGQNRVWDRTWDVPELGSYYGILFHWPEVERFDGLGEDYLGILACQERLGSPLLRHGVLFPPQRPQEAPHG